MTTELSMLTASAALYFALIMLVATTKIFQKGMPWALGNRDEDGAEVAAWVGRGQRAIANMQENLLLFAILVFAVMASGKTNDTTALGAQVFLGARALHAITYLAGITVVRTLAWFGGVAGCVMVALALL